MITTSIMGGLGNQLFQIFAAIAYAIQNKTQFYFLYGNPKGHNTVRYTYWNSFLKSLEMFTVKNESSLNVIEIHQRIINYSPIQIVPNLINQHFRFVGYFQSPLFFQNEFETIIRMIRYKEISNEIRAKYSEYTFDSNTISMHFRLGDYKPIQHCHPIMTKEYYEKALEYILLNTEDLYTVYYFCEAQDNVTVSETIDHLTNIYNDNVAFVKIADTIEDWEQMILMSLCKHHIIANSTFSWWGSYFSKVFTNESITCYPSLWFGPSIQNHNIVDLFPKEWVKINV
jgi:hypothetical protein